MKEYTGLDNLRNPSSNRVYCPKCGDYLEVVMNGFFHGQLFYCSKEKKVFAVTLKDITKISGKEYIKQCEEDIAVKEVKYRITRENYKSVRFNP